MTHFQRALASTIFFFADRLGRQKSLGSSNQILCATHRPHNLILSTSSHWRPLVTLYSIYLQALARRAPMLRKIKSYSFLSPKKEPGPAQPATSPIRVYGMPPVSPLRCKTFRSKLAASHVCSACLGCMAENPSELYDRTSWQVVADFCYPEVRDRVVLIHRHLTLYWDRS